MSMSELNTQLEYLAETKEQIKTAITNKGQDITSSVPFREYVDKINNISTLQVDTADANAKVGDIVKDKTAYVNGEKITGTLRESASVFFRAESVTLDNEFNIVKSQGPNNYSGERVVMSSGATGWTEIPYQTLADTIGVTAEKIVQGNTILGIEGTATTGIDTSDATATSGDLAINKTAYVNGEKITGTLPLFPNTSTFTVSNAGVTNNIEDSTLDLTTINTTKQILDSNVSMNFNADYSEVAAAIGLTADKIKAGETILGVEGTLPSGSLPYELVDLSNLESGTSIMGFKVDLSVTPDYTKDYSSVSVINSSTNQGLIYAEAYNGSDRLMVIGEDMFGSGGDLGCSGHIYEFTKTDKTITGAKVVATQTYFIFTSPLTIDFISLNGIDLPIQAIKAL